MDLKPISHYTQYIVVRVFWTQKNFSWCIRLFRYTFWPAQFCANSIVGVLLEGKKVGFAEFFYFVNVWNHWKLELSVCWPPGSKFFVGLGFNMVDNSMEFFLDKSPSCLWRCATMWGLFLLEIPNDLWFVNGHRVCWVANLGCFYPCIVVGRHKRRHLVQVENGGEAMVWHFIDVRVGRESSGRFHWFWVLQDAPGRSWCWVDDQTHISRTWSFQSLFNNRQLTFVVWQWRKR